MSPNLSSSNLSHWPTFVKDNFNSTLHPNYKNGNLRPVSDPIRQAENKYLNDVNMANQGAGRAVPTLTLSASFHLWNLTQDVYQERAPQRVYFYKMGPFPAHTSSWFYTFTVTFNLMISLAIIPQTPHIISRPFAFTQDFVFPHHQDKGHQSLLWPFGKATMRWQKGR